MGSVESRCNLFHLASQVIEFGVPGDFVEVGCNAGESSVVLQKVMQTLDPTRKLYLFDSFEGTPDPDVRDEGAYSKGDMTASQNEVLSNFKTMGLPLPEIHPGWFDDTLPKGLPNRIAFSLIDGDLYSSTMTALQNVYPRLVPHSVCILAVYCDPKVFTPLTTSLKYRSPGVKKACDEFFADKPEKVSVLFSGHYTAGYFRKKSVSASCSL